MDRRPFDGANGSSGTLALDPVYLMRIGIALVEKAPPKLLTNILAHCTAL